MPIPLNAEASISTTPRLVDHLPLAGLSAFDTFEKLDHNLLYHKSLGCSHQSLDTMICDCQFDPCKHLPIGRIRWPVRVLNILICLQARMTWLSLAVSHLNVSIG